MRALETIRPAAVSEPGFAGLEDYQDYGKQELTAES